jgi:hypothetical protein
MYDRKWKKAKLTKKKIKLKKKNLINLKIKDILARKFYLIQMFVAKSGFGNSMITP